MAAAPSASATPLALGQVHSPAYVALAAGDLEPPHPAEPVQTLDGTAAPYMGTIPTTRNVEIMPESYGGAASTTQVAGP